jgi:GTPase SAR1 family protein
MALRAKTPEAKSKRIKMMMFGPAGVGKTTAAIGWPSSVVIDMERGTDSYHESLKKAGSVVFQTTNPDEVKEEIKALMTEKHPYTTIIIDPVTILYGAIQEKWTRIFSKYADTEKATELQDFGFRYWAKVKSDYKAIMRMLLTCDLNVILTAHQKDLYGEGMKKVGLGSDSMRGDEHIFDYIFQLTQDAKGRRMAVTRKERAEIGRNKFPAEFEWSYANFLIYYGKDALERESTPVPLATAEQVAEVKRLLSIVKVDESWESDCLTKADVDTWEELTAEKMQKALDYLNKKKEGK